MLFLVGAAEMFLSVCLYFGIVLIPLKDNHKPYEINYIIFMAGFTLEIGYWLLTRIALALVYLKTYGQY
jgi:hypothetical protein